ncbi:ParB/RepB/Spo0J family partition protein [Lacticaseibacillus pabuli]|uniref:ParB/RepB/Spo0J family partition protein n=1 Tax=Lacticaseibacillus pabuli TaxID=3025672 RepID=A0ABY7WQV2_9LACO|nr:ParB/RepB/Spo0J family partition protein [Lacticaseibacillus sp. KACC 23028]WDF82562.1 ParB/RepB/Spo0J family partition protein [Lacticaseibacillus sp. KACC 23028]
MVNKKAKGLGRGIDAIFGDIDTEVRSDDTVQDLPITEIRANPYQPRQTFDDAALEDLARSIKETGVFQPIIVRKSVNGYELIAGERRTRASKLAGKTTIPAIVREFDEQAMMEVAVLENLQRENLTPIEEAQAYDMLIKKLNLTQAQVSQRLGKSRPYIANYLRLLSLPNQVKQLLSEGKLSMGQARTLLSLKDKRKILPMAKRTVDEGLTVRQLEKLIADINAGGKKPAKKPAHKQSPYLKASENQLVDHFGTKVSIAQTQKGKGHIEINFTDTEELNRILSLLDVNID